MLIKSLLILFLELQRIIQVDMCLHKQSPGKATFPANSNQSATRTKLYTRKEYPTCQCATSDPNYSKDHYFHLHAKILPNNQAITCMVAPIASNLLLTTHQCLMKSAGKLYPYETWPITHGVRNTAQLSELRVNSIFYKGFINVTIKHIISHPKYSMTRLKKTQLTDNDVAIIVIEESLMDLNFNTFCLPKSDVSSTDVLYHEGEYIGTGGMFADDNTTETRMVRQVIMKADECIQQAKFEITNSGDNFCIRFRDEGPTWPGGPLSVLGSGVSPTPYLIGLASIVGYDSHNGAIKYAFFTNLIPQIGYIEHYAEKFNGKWCEMRKFTLGKPVSEENRKISLNPWEAGVKIPDRVVDSSCVCGLRSEAFKPPSPGGGIRSSNARISGGQETIPDEFPWMIRLNQGSHPRASFCGASLINDRMLLTAAHCVVYQDHISGQLGTYPPDHLKAYAFMHHSQFDLLPNPNNNNQPKAIPLEIENVVVYKDYYLGRQKGFFANYDSDIAVLILKESWMGIISKSSDIKDLALLRPVCLPERGENIDLVGKTAYLSGWGFTAHPSLQGRESDVLKKGAYPIRSLKECANFTYGVITPNVVCATSYSVHDSGLPGDSGSPLTIEFDSKTGLRTQIGLTSYGDEFDRKEHKDIHLVLYTNVQRFLDFIDFIANAVGAKWCRKTL